FFRFDLDVAPSASPETPHLQDVAFPGGPIVRVPSLPQTGNVLQSPFPVNSAYISLADDLPDGLEWTSTLEGITGIATESRVTALNFTSTWGEPEHEGRLLISAGDYRSAA